MEQQSSIRVQSSAAPAAHYVAQRKSVSLTDNRPSPGVLHGTEVLQAKSKVQNAGQTFTWGGKKTIVGSKMKAWLDPGDPLKGEEATVNTNQTLMMDALRLKYGIQGGDLVRGHLLNDNLGGKAMNNNLFPITRKANKAHLLTTENFAKKELWENKNALWYTVNVTGTADENTPKHSFDVAIGPWDMNYNVEGAAALTGSIVSDLGNYKDKSAANPGSMPNYSVKSLEDAVKNGEAIAPHSGSSTLSKDDSDKRDNTSTITNSEHDSSGYTFTS